MINLIKGNLLETDCQYICHQVNCQGKMNSGVAKAIREKWPVVYKEYQNWYNYWCQKVLDDYGGCEDYPNPSEVILGQILMVKIDNNQTVINMAAQQYYGYDGKRYTSYDAFWMCLGEIKSKVPKGSKIAFPYNIGCCRGGANWEVIYAMIVAVLNEDYDIYFYRLEE